MTRHTKEAKLTRHQKETQNALKRLNKLMEEYAWNYAKMQKCVQRVHYRTLLDYLATIIELEDAKELADKLKPQKKETSCSSTS